MNCDEMRIVHTPTPKYINKLGLCGDTHLMIEPDGECLLVLLGDDILGILVYEIRSDSGYIETLCTKNPDCHRVGSFLLRYFEEWCLSLDKDFILLEPLQSAIGFYIKRGFHELPSRNYMIKYLNYIYSPENVNVIFGRRMSGFMIEIERNNEGNVMKYISKGRRTPIDMTLKNSAEYNPLELAIAVGNENVINAILDILDVPSIQVDIDIYSLIRYTSFNVLQKLIKKGLNVRSRDERGRTLLHQVILYKRFDIVFPLIDAGVDVNIQDDLGQTALIKLCLNEHSKVASIIIKSNANVNIQDIEGMTALMYAVDRNDIIMVALLLQAGAKLNLFDINGRSVSDFTKSPNIKLLIQNVKRLDRMKYPEWNRLFKEDAFFWTSVARNYSPRAFEYFVSKYKEKNFDIRELKFDF